jgi:hypothetical protein
MNRLSSEELSYLTDEEKKVYLGRLSKRTEFNSERVIMRFGNIIAELKKNNKGVVI